MALASSASAAALDWANSAAPTHPCPAIQARHCICATPAKTGCHCNSPARLAATPRSNPDPFRRQTTRSIRLGSVALPPSRATSKTGKSSITT